jgi:S1-C subfamily serine protease
MSNEFGLKELYELTLKATYPIEMEGRKFEAGEVIARFDKIQIANFKELTSRVSANGGKANPALVIWEDPKEIQLTFT